MKRWGFPCAGESACAPVCGPATFGDVAFPVCPGHAARTSWRLQAALIKRREGQICGGIDARTVPAWLLEDLSRIEAAVAAGGRK